MKLHGSQARSLLDKTEKVLEQYYRFNSYFHIQQHYDLTAPCHHRCKNKFDT